MCLMRLLIAKYNISFLVDVFWVCFGIKALTTFFLLLFLFNICQVLMTQSERIQCIIPLSVPDTVWLDIIWKYNHINLFYSPTYSQVESISCDFRVSVFLCHSSQLLTKFRSLNHMIYRYFFNYVNWKLHYQST